jgi:hypothetical protein
MQLGCRVMENREMIENKGESEYFSQFKRTKNCAIRDAVAQWKLKWRSFVGSFLNWIFSRQKNFACANFCHGQPNQTLWR